MNKDKCQEILELLEKLYKSKQIKKEVLYGKEENLNG
jgi:hypothetical protein